MQEACIYDILTGNYTDVNDTQSLRNLTHQALRGIANYKCEPFDCNGNGRCVNGRCVCNSGMSAKIRIVQYM